MTGSRTKRSTINIVVNIFNRIVSLLLPFALRTVMIQKLGVEYLGLNGLFSSLLSMLSLSELGFSSAVIFAMYKPMAEGNNEEVIALLNFYKKIYRTVALVISALGLIALPFLDHFIASDYPRDINIYAVYIIYLVNTVLSYGLFAYKNSILVASMRSDLDSTVTTLSQAVMYALQIIVLIVARDYYIYALCMPLGTVLTNIAKLYIVDKKYPQYKGVGKLSKEKKRDIITRVGALIGNKIGGVVFSSVDSIVISSFLGLAVLGKYSNYFLIYNSVVGIQILIFSSMQAVIGNSLVCRSEEENSKTFYEMFLINNWITICGSCCFIGLYQPFMKMWVGEENMLPFIIPALLTFYYFVRGIRRVCYAFKEAAGMWREDWLKPYVSVVVNLIVNIILVKLIGLSGIVISSIAALMLVEIPWEVHIFFKLYFKKSEFGYYLQIFKFSLVALVATVGSYFACMYIPENIIGFVLRIVICIIIPNILFFAVYFRTEEFNSAKDRVLRLIKRK